MGGVCHHQYFNHGAGKDNRCEKNNIKSPVEENLQQFKMGAALAIAVSNNSSP